MSSGPSRGTQPGAGDAPAPLSSWITTHETSIGAASVPEELRLTPGSMLAGRYRIVALLGRGGMGEIYRAEDTKLGQAVALKFLRGAVADDPALLERLLAEVRIGRKVSHPNVCRLYDVVEFEGRHFIAMEYVDGEDLASLLSRIGRLPPDKTLDELRSQHLAAKAPRLTSSVRLEPVVERAVLQCLEEDPQARPGSVRAFAAALPGGDPLEVELWVLVKVFAYPSF